MTRVAVLGLGAMGSRVARNLMKAGHEVTVYNRSPAPAEALRADGAIRAATPSEAAAQAEIVISMVSTDDAARAIWLDAEHGAVRGLRPNAIAVESSTVTIAWVNELAAHVSSGDATFLDAPVVGSRPQAEAGQLIHLVGGEAQTLERARSVLEVIGSAIHHVGPIGQGMTMKLVVNALFGIQVAAVAELIGLIDRSDIAAERAAAILAELPVTSPAVKGALTSITSRNFAANFPLDLVEKDFRYTLEFAQQLAAKLPTTAAVHDVFERGQREGYGDEHLTGIARLFM